MPRTYKTNAEDLHEAANKPMAIRFASGAPIPMYGNTVPELSIEVSLDDGETWKKYTVRKVRGYPGLVSE